MILKSNIWLNKSESLNTSVPSVVSLSVALGRFLTLYLISLVAATASCRTFIEKGELVESTTISVPGIPRLSPIFKTLESPLKSYS